MAQQTQPSRYGVLKTHMLAIILASRLSTMALGPIMHPMLIVVVVQCFGLTVYPWVLAGLLCTVGIACVSFILLDGVYDVVSVEFLRRNLTVQAEFIGCTMQICTYKAVIRIVVSLYRPTSLFSVTGLRDALVIFVWVRHGFIDRQVEKFITWALLKGLQEVDIISEMLLAGCLSVRYLMTAKTPGSTTHQGQLQSLRYQYCALAEGEIRLLSLARRAPFSLTEINLFTVKLQEAPPYEAISYTWGTSTQKCEMLINGKLFTTSAAAHEAISGRSSIWRSRLIWIDYVCINQDDPEERATQVKQMINVYRKAERVVAWLAKFDLEVTTCTALEMMHSLLFSLDRGISNAQIYKALFSRQRDAQWRALMKAFDHAWFTRVWIVQEVSVAENVFFSYGGILFSWDSFLKLVNSLLNTYNQSFFDSTPGARRAGQNLANLGMIHNTRTITRHNRLRSAIERYREVARRPSDPKLRRLFEDLLARHNTNALNPLSGSNGISNDSIAPFYRLSFAHLLTAYGDFGAKDARDKIYALRGLVTDPLTSTTEPNYTTKSAESLYIDLAETIWTSDQPFGIIGWAGIGLPRALDIPSFVPDWTSPPTPLKPLTSAFYQQGEADVRYRASGGTRSEILFVLSNDQPSIELAGIVVDKVKVLGMLTPRLADQNDQSPNSDLDAFVQTNWNWYNEISALMADNFVGGRGKSPVETLWRTLLCDRKGTARPAPPEMKKEYETWLEMRWKMAKFVRARSSGEEIEPISEDYVFKEEHVHMSWAFHMSEACNGRRFGITEQGRAGIFPGLTEVGDTICIAYGAETPWALRLTRDAATQTSTSVPTGDNDYLLVGECYVHGIMDGEAINHAKQPGHVRLW